MKPRIFVSSTFYDLKYIREELENYIKAHDFEPILFENGDVGYTPNMSLDESCYRAISISDMAILIIGEIMEVQHLTKTRISLKNSFQ